MPSIPTLEPPVLIAPADTAVTTLVLFGAATAAVFVALVTMTVRRRDPLPLALFFGGIACSIPDPIYDWLAKMVFASNQPMAFRLIETSVPWWAVMCYSGWFGLLPYLIARRMAKGASRHSLYLISFAGMLGILFFEVVNANWLHAWEYYGEQPLKYLGSNPAVATLPVVIGFVLYTVAWRLTGWRRMMAGLVIPPAVSPMLLLGTTWPVNLALHSDLPVVLDYLAVALSGLLVVGTLHVTSGLARQWRAGRLALEELPSPRSAGSKPPSVVTRG